MSRLAAFFKARPMSWTPLETLAMRLFFALVILFSGIIWEAAKLPPPGVALEKANGLAKLLPLGWLADPAVLNAGKPLAAIGLLLYVLGVMPVLSLLPALIYMLGTGALRNSLGDISHHTQLVSMVLLGQWIVYLVSAIREKAWVRAAAALQQRVVFWSILVIGATYLASGMVKLKASDFQWIQRSPALSVQVIKAVYSESYSSGNPVSGFKAQEAPLLIAQHPWLARIFFGAGLLLELAGAFLALSRRHALGIALGLIAMHLGISLLMEIDFVNHILLLLIFAVNLPGLLLTLRKKPPQPESPDPDSPALAPAPTRDSASSTENPAA